MEDFFGALDPFQGTLDHDLGFALVDFQPASVSVSKEDYSPVEYREICKAKGCSNGKFIAFPSGRVVGQCYACKGLGYKTFKTSPEVRKAAQEKRFQNKLAWEEEHKDVLNWIRENFNKFSFATSLCEAFKTYGRLTEGQVEAARRCIQKAQERKEAWKAQKALDASKAPEIVTDKLMEAFNKASQSGLKTPKMRFETFQASMAPAHGKNPGAVYIKAGEAYLGMIKDGRFLKSRDCSPQMFDNVISTMADPLAAAVAYGKRTGNCSCCGRELENKLSVELGIGPICREKFGM